MPTATAAAMRGRLAHAHAATLFLSLAACCGRVDRAMLLEKAALIDVMSYSEVASELNPNPIHSFWMETATFHLLLTCAALAMRELMELRIGRPAS